MESYFVLNLTIILLSGLIAGCICKRLKASPLIGYLLVGALIGPGCLDLTNSKEYDNALESTIRLEHATHGADGSSDASSGESIAEPSGEDSEANPIEARRNRFPHTTIQENVELKRELEEKRLELAAREEQLSAARANTLDNEELAAMRSGRFALEGATEFGVLLLLFSIGVELTFAKLTATAKYMFVGGLLQMGGTIGLAIVVCMLFGMSWVAGLALGSVVALSSTALVYRSLGDLGLADTKRSQATLGVLIFQDVALVPLLLILPIVLGGGDSSEPKEYLFNNPWIDMTVKSIVFCAITLLMKYANTHFLINQLARLRSNDMVILYAVVLLLGMCVLAGALGLTPALGALAAGVALAENRLTHQIDALILPFREAFSAMFFISLGMLTDFSYVFAHPVVCVLALVGAILFKAVCCTGALRACGMDFRGALAFGVSISQIGELAFMLLTTAYASGAIDEPTYNTMLFVCVGSLVATPNMIKIAMTKFGMEPEAHEISGAYADVDPKLFEAMASARAHAIIVGAGHIGQTLANDLISRNLSVCLIDFNPVNLQSFNQNGIPTVTGDGANYDVLRKAGIGRASVVFVTVPRDDLALNVVNSVTAINPTAIIAARSRYRLNVSPLERAGARLVLCEENYVADELVKLLAEYFERNDKQTPEPTPAPAA